MVPSSVAIEDLDRHHAGAEIGDLDPQAPVIQDVERGSPPAWE
jgi:hypothetical protein